MSYINRPRQIAIAAAILYVLGLVILTRLPLADRIQLEENGATIDYRIDRRFVLFPNACVNHVWQIEGIQAILFDGRDTTGNDSARHCGVSYVPPLRVDFTDGNTTFYWLSPTIVGQNPFALLGVMLAIGLLFYGMMPPSWSRPIAQGLNLIVVWVVVTFVVLEVLFRGWVLLTGNETSKLLYLGSPQAIANANRNYIAMPFLNYLPSPVRSDVNAIGLRGGEISIDKPDDTFRIVAMGGSTTYGLYLEADETWPHHLQQILRDEYGYEQVEVLNAGVEGYNSLNSLVNLQTRILELSPDMVFIYHGANDSAHVGFSDDCYRGYNIYLGIAGAATFDFDNPDLGPSALLRFVNFSLGRIPDPSLDQDFHSGFTQTRCDMSASPSSDPTHYFERNISNMIRIAQAYDIQPVLSNFAFQYVNDVEQMTVYTNYQRIPEFNAVLADVADEFDVPIFDLAGELPYDEAYWQEDKIHQSAEGTLAQAELYAAFLDGEGLIPAP